jgi:hypothetical protein
MRRRRAASAVRDAKAAERRATARDADAQRAAYGELLLRYFALRARAMRDDGARYTMARHLPGAKTRDDFSSSLIDDDYFRRRLSLPPFLRRYRLIRHFDYFLL